jgi:hypothetical protein
MFSSKVQGCHCTSSPKSALATISNDHGTSVPKSALTTISNVHGTSERTSFCIKLLARLTRGWKYASNREEATTALQQLAESTLSPRKLLRLHVSVSGESNIDAIESKLTKPQPWLQKIRSQRRERAVCVVAFDAFCSFSSKLSQPNPNQRVRNLLSS